jgi:hypothetical protein
MTPQRQSNEDRMKELLAAAAALPQETMSPEELSKAEDQERLGQKLVRVENGLKKLDALPADLESLVGPRLDAAEARIAALNGRLDRFEARREQLVADVASAVIDRIAITQRSTEPGQPKTNAGLWKPFAITLAAILVIIVGTVVVRALC